METQGEAPMEIVLMLDDYTTRQRLRPAQNWLSQIQMVVLKLIISQKIALEGFITVSALLLTYQVSARNHNVQQWPPHAAVCFRR